MNYKDIFKFECRPRQIESFLLIDNDKNVLVVLPTAYGKTAIAIYSALKCKELNKKFIMLVPLKALSSEHFDVFSFYGLSVRIFNSDYENDLSLNYDVYIFTYEKYNSILRKNKNWWFLEHVYYLCIDEIHNIIDKSRGFAIETSILKTKIINQNVKYIGLSATIGECDDLLTFINAEKVEAKPEERPVPLEIKILKIPSKYDIIPITKNLLKDGMNSIIFVKSRNDTTKFAYSLNGKKDSLEDLIENGIGYHNAGLSIKERELSEKSYRKGKINYMFSTSSLSMGVNFPAKRVIITEPYYYSTLKGEEPMEPNELLQKCGRAGRSKLDNISYAVILCPELFFEIIKNSLEPQDIISVLNDDFFLLHLILELIATEICGNEYEIFKALEKSMITPNMDKIKKNIDFLSVNKFIYWNRKYNKFIATFIGRMTIQLYISIYTAIHLRDCDCEGISLYKKFFKILDIEEFVDTVIVRSEDQLNITYAKDFLLEKIIDLSDIKNKDKILKCFFLLFRDELLTKYPDLKIYFSAGDYKILKNQAQRILSAGSIFGNKSIINECDAIIKLIENKKFNIGLATLSAVKGIGNKRLEKLLKNDIDDIDKFINFDINKLSTMLGLTPDTIRGMKEHAKKLHKNMGF